MSKKLYVIGVGINPALEQHVKLTFDKEILFVSRKREISASWKVLINTFKVSRSKVLIYNTSIFNVLLIIILKLFKNKVLFHLHDPIPHSGWLNPIIFIVNFLTVAFSDCIIVFSNGLKRQTSRFYLPKKIIIAKHGLNPFKYQKELADTKKITVGFFGRNMPYKNYNKFIEYIKSNPDYTFYTFGNGYPEINFQNHKLISGYINDDKYYSYMKDIDYVFFAHKTISYSGVLHDAMNLKKKIILDNNTYQETKYFNKTKISDNNLLKETSTLDTESRSWIDYKNTIANTKT